MPDQQLCHKMKKSVLFPPQTDDEGRKAELERKLVKRDEEILQLQDDKLTLEDQVEELESREWCSTNQA